MPQNNRLQFSVEESICFQKGQEVSELLSISLDPDITVQEVNDYVSIRGSLELTGEYNIDQTREYAELPATSRFVEDVKLKGDGSAELTHCFPVDITIPKDKVNHLNDVFVFIDAFDYQLTDARMLTIQADLAIEGLLNVSGEAGEEEPRTMPAAVQPEEELEPAFRSPSDDEEQGKEEEFLIQLDRSYEEQDEEQPYEEAEETDTDAEAVPIYQSFLGDDTEETKPFFTASLSAAERTKREMENPKDAALEHPEEEYELNREKVEAKPEEYELKREKVEAKPEEYEQKREKAEEKPEEYELKREEAEEEPEPLQRAYQPHDEPKETPFYGVPPLLEEDQNDREPETFEVEVTQEAEAIDEEEEAGHTIEIPEYSFHEQTEPEEERDEMPAADDQEVSAKENDNALYLTKLFTKQGEEEFTRMRMCIVQQNDTIDLLCERYDINVQQLIRMNSLSLDEELKEGQILYIPDYQNSHA
ncbi:LysM peptidoglycan-binding domain-containing protein [Bacillus paralicheniformis]|uniref:LysM peptidoglycan-binding domain-containing protein n=1 Tax=Bacillus paralicheniformis TaxID=1648923 RepID=UPI0011A7DD54|nr:LysM peptidoglycan-binding domain-containing protein [Bacillus paralicheniformis]MCY7460643.1 LysM peptidoglycan-binding domain-containing protein [Bacillus paralicheniformis]MED1240186.1 LysM peptidoglycan-binding domain-containing protein [Bacillus paralicheniformis]TWJ49424.1 Stage VI sporulation protein D [Bacillus paralicheniformis]TWM06546.1 Stage VI sporulation protein D [Bacillus paralicheniformis]